MRIQGYIMAMAAGLALRLGMAGYLGKAAFAGDAGYYLAAAQDLISGQWPGYWPPGWPALLIPVACLGAPLWASALWMAGWYGLTCCLLKKWLLRWGASLAQVNLAFWFFAVLPSAAAYGALPLTQGPTAALILAAWLAIDRRPALAGCLGALAVCLRPATGLFFGAIGFFEGKTKKRPVFIAGFAFIFSLALVGLGLRYHTGRWIPLNDANAYNFYLGNHALAPDYANWWLGSHGQTYPARFAPVFAEIDSLRRLAPLARTKGFQTIAWTSLASDPGRFALRLFHRFRVFFATDTYGAGQAEGAVRALIFAFEMALHSLYGWLAVMGFFALPLAWRWRILVGALSFMAPYLIAFAHPSYHFPLVLLGAPLVLRGAQLLRQPPTQWFGSAPADRLAGWACLMFFAFIQGEWAFFWLSPNLPY